MRIVSLLPSATESLFALGLGDQLVAVTHECDYPLEAPDVEPAAAHRDRFAAGGRAASRAGRVPGVVGSTLSRGALDTGPALAGTHRRPTGEARRAVRAPFVGRREGREGRDARARPLWL